MLRTITQIISLYPATISVAIAGVISQSLFAVYWGLTVAGITQMNIDSTEQVALMLYALRFKSFKILSMLQSLGYSGHFISCQMLKMMARFRYPSEILL